LIAAYCRISGVEGSVIQENFPAGERIIPSTSLLSCGNHESSIGGSISSRQGFIPPLDEFR